MKAPLLLCLVCLFLPLTPALKILNTLNSEVLSAWNAFKVDYQKTYQNPAEELLRFNAFRSSLAQVVSHNLLFDYGLQSFKLGLNKYSDLTPSEFNKLMKGLSSLQDITKNLTIFNGQTETSGVPKSVNWTSQISGVKDQGACGSCWAFSAIGAVEGRYSVKYDKIIPLSQQNLVDCASQSPYSNFGCEGGWMNSAFQYIKDNGGVSTSEAYPYRAENGTSCAYTTANKAPVVVIDYLSIDKGNEEALKAAVATGPVAVALDTSQPSFQLYSSGVYDEVKCSPDNIDHAVLAVGYGTHKGKPYWLIQNSWGPSWGINGYMMLARNAKNKCGIATAASFPNIE